MRRMRAFTLLEIMVVLVITGTLAFVALSAWPSYVQRSRRAAAGAALIATLAQLEMQHMRTGKYDPEDSGPPLEVDGYSLQPQNCTRLDLVKFPDDCVQVVAMSTAPSDRACPVLILRSTGEREPDDPACWP